MAKKKVKKLDKKTVKPGKLMEAMKKMPSSVLVSPTPFIRPDGVNDVYRQLEDHWKEITAQYSYDLPRPDHVTSKMQAVLGAPDLDQAQQRATRARATMQTTILSAWAKGKIQGPVSEASLERDIKAAEGLANMLNDKGQKDAAATQYARLETLLSRLRALRQEAKAQAKEKPVQEDPALTTEWHFTYNRT